MAMAGHQRAVAEVVVDVFVTVQIVYAGAVAVAHEQRIRRIVTIVAGYSERDTVNGPPMRFAGLGRALFVGLDLLL
jgi:tRNA G37 N-methylase Trm5